jgi:dTDP-4-amino-4,6-dideoxygalactose transaminase
MDTICDIAKRHNLLVVEDAAQAYLSYYKGRACGTIGNFGCFSFHYTKNVMCGEGGALSVNRSPELARRAVVMWEKGTNRYDFMLGKIDKYEWIDVGSSFVPSEVGCAILYAQLQESREITQRRVRNFEFYRSNLSSVVAKAALHHIRIVLPSIPENCFSNGHIFAVLLQYGTNNIRGFFETHLKARGISAFAHYVPLHSAAAGVKHGRVGSAMTVSLYSFVFYPGAVWEFIIRCSSLLLAIAAVERARSSLLVLYSTVCSHDACY